MGNIVIGIDPGLNITGYAALRFEHNTIEICEAGVLRSKRTKDLGTRIAQLYDGLMEVLELHRPSVMAIEELYSHYKRPQTAILMGHARGAFCLAAAKHSVPVFNYSATQIKKVLTGNGRAPKEQMQFAVMRELNLKQVPDPPDIADAMAIGICHYFLNRQTAVPESDSTSKSR